jgi:glutamyl/glutaminyl-tRNA synthetase
MSGVTFRMTRIAPTPSGYLHLGNIMSFAITATLAHRYGADILLRIDDMDRERSTPEYIEDIFSTLAFMELPWQYGPRTAMEFEEKYSQRHRLPLYQNALEALAATGKIFACTCSRAQIPDGIYPGTCRHKQIPLDAPGVSWRLRTDESPISLNTLAGTIQATLPDTLRDLVVRKKDGFPAYQLTSVVDDIHYNTDLVVRGNDLYPSSLAQLYLAAHLPQNNFGKVVFHHHALLTQNNEKLSKTAGAISIQHLRKEGFTAVQIWHRIADMAGISTPIMGPLDFPVSE